ncbi:type IX secretion system motor protein PorM/GldM [Bacteroides heparinolyticus]|uniref:type IX secretion system motor protein PorM/GldM n=1 Tax=Prevotella heparinolytica TaxID=28113 RepID=UPI0035A06AE5
MSGAKNCPETPRQKMIAMMYLVLTAMLALNVSADILKGFGMINRGLITSIQSAEERNKYLMLSFEELNARYPEKIGEWLQKAKEVESKSNELFDYMQNFKYEMIKLADGADADKNAVNIKKQDDTNVSGQYGINQGNAQILKKKIEDYREFIKNVYGGDNEEKNQEYDRIFSTGSVKGLDKVPLGWVEANFESMPLVSVVTMLSKYQTDIRSAQTEAIQYLKNQTDAGDFRVNEILAEVIPESKTVVAGGQYKARIILAARDTNAKPQIFVNGTQVTDPNGLYTVGVGGSIGPREITGKIVLKDPVTGEPREYPIKSEYSVVAPSATIANEDMNVVYMGYANRLSISAPGFPSDKLSVSAINAKLESQGGGRYICRPSSYEGVTINVSASVDGKSIPMGSGKFRVRALPNPTAFLRFKDASGNVVLFNPTVNKNVRLTRQALANADMVAEYEDGLLQATFNVTGFTVSISDGRGGFVQSSSDGKNFTEAQKNNFLKIKSGTPVLFEKIKVTGAKSAELAFPRVDIP